LGAGVPLVPSVTVFEDLGAGVALVVSSVSGGLAVEAAAVDVVVVFEDLVSLAPLAGVLGSLCFAAETPISGLISVGPVVDVVVFEVLDFVIVFKDLGAGVPLVPSVTVFEDLGAGVALVVSSVSGGLAVEAAAVDVVVVFEDLVSLAPLAGVLGSLCFAAETPISGLISVGPVVDVVLEDLGSVTVFEDLGAGVALVPSVSGGLAVEAAAVDVVVVFADLVLDSLVLQGSSLNFFPLRRRAFFCIVPPSPWTESCSRRRARRPFGFDEDSPPRRLPYEGEFSSCSAARRLERLSTRSALTGSAPSSQGSTSAASTSSAITSTPTSISSMLIVGSI